MYEQIKNRTSATQTAGQRLLIPETVECGYKDANILEGLIPDLKAVGLEIEPFGGNTFVVTSVPSLLSGREIKPLIIEIIEKMVEIGFAPGIKNVIDECLILMACHSAIRANQALSDKEIRLLLEQLDVCENPSHCPHGRPTWIKWTNPMIEKAFKRTL
jgi:DNA mismatch repair protein MutL